MERGFQQASSVPLTPTVRDIRQDVDIIWLSQVGGRVATSLYWVGARDAAKQCRGKPHNEDFSNLKCQYQG